MATAEELRTQISTAHRVLQEATDLTSQLDGAIDDANERQRLRRELDRVQGMIVGRRDLNNYKRMRRQWIDDDADGDHRPNDEVVAWRQARHSTSSNSNEEVMSCSTVVAKGEYVWKIEGISWLMSTLDQVGEEYASSDVFSVDVEDFRLVYHPTCGTIGSYYRDDQRGSLAVKHLGGNGVTFRYKVFIKDSSGEFVQWGPLGDECHPNENTFGSAFGPDVRLATDRGNTMPMGIFGLSHEELLVSDWVVADALTVKFELAVRPDADFSTIKPHVEVTPPTLSANLCSLLEDGRCSDITFVLSDGSIKAHSQIICARSEVFDKQLHGGMREATSKEIVVEDCDVATFKAFLQFLYTDDFAFMEQVVKTACADSARSGGGSSSGDTGGSESDSVANVRTSLLQSVLAVSHRYQVERLRLWCQRMLCNSITVSEVCSVLCQAHMYDARQLEEACLRFIKSNLEKVVVTPSFGSLGKEWPEVVLKINLFLAGVSETSAQAAIEAHRQTPRGEAEGGKKPAAKKQKTSSSS
eukprot:TRINITY_DN57323_c0_g1_i1.p1 TRINITY_DN57323_c0_g1~~TRINITY_DN57323_c0_g1_i1.p1  ORF type:complete len:527 (-),score=129.24 TRINITY_DN57323_c0_g1_i1:154-1734(-)